MHVIIKFTLLVLASFLVACAQTESISKPSIMQQRYAAADQFLPDNLLAQIDNLYIQPNWLEGGGFWYQLSNEGSKSYWRYSVSKGVSPLFELEKLANALGTENLDELTKSLSIAEVKDDTINFSVNQTFWQCSMSPEYHCQQEPIKTIGSKGITSPDGNWEIVIREHNLYLIDLNTSEETQLTFDGEPEFAYATQSPNPTLLFNQPEGSVEPRKVGYWSPDSRHFVTFQLDLRKVKKLHLTQSVTGKSQRPRIYRFHYPMAGDAHLIEGHLVVANIDSKTANHVVAPALLQTYYGDPLWGEFASNNKYYYLERERGFHRFHLKELSPESGKVRTLVTETNDKFIDPWIQDFRILPEQDMILWTSERNGIQQVFSYRLQTAELLSAVTPESMFIRAIKAIDSKNRQLYFEASGALPGDPYYRYLYRTDFDGQNLTLLTPETAMHDTHVSPDFQTVIDTFSRVNQAPAHTVRRISDGKIVDKLLSVDTQKLDELGYQPPQPFSVLAQDGKTKLYGLLYFPSNFDPQKTYPVIDDIYTGPHGYFTPKTYAGPLYSHALALAELGFIVLKMDGRGTGKRDRAFHEYSYKNLAGGADDHVWALQQLAATRPYLDLDRVGIYGFSAGGYDTVRAMYRFPDFYKVGVAASGNHDFRADKAGWNETWMDYPVGPHWNEQSNLTDADKLEGELLLAHGELDENVHPAATFQLVDKLIQFNKDFKLMIYPNMGHVLHNHPHFVKMRWDFFVRHLLNVKTPIDYAISNMSIPIR